MKKYTKCEVFSEQQYLSNKKQYNKYDIVYSARKNFGSSHYFTIYKQPKELSDIELANIIDGYFFAVFRSGNTLDCWFD